MDRFQKRAHELLDFAGIKINGKRKFDIQVHNPQLFQRVFTEGSLGLGEAYMEEWWDCQDLEELFFRLIRSGLDQRLVPLRLLGTFIQASLVNLQKPSRTFTIGRRHYDIGNDLFELMLDKRLTYSCGFWKGTRSLDKAQINKVDLVCKKLYLKPGMKVLDIGCGWGSALYHAAKNYGVEGLGITVSRNQVEKARELCRDLPVEFRLQDYRDLEGQFDRIWSIGMIEHVGVKNYRTFMRVVKNCLSSDGLFLLHTIGGNRSVIKSDPWINRYIFPNSMVPSIRQLGLSWENLLVMEDWQNMGIHYLKTLRSWYKNILRYRDKLLKSYDERFLRMWEYYLQVSAGAFKARKLHVWQIVLSPNGIPQGYKRV